MTSTNGEETVYLDKEVDINDLEYTEEWLQVGDLDIDRRVQRFNLNNAKVEKFVRRFNAAALGVITVSQRGPVTRVIIDGQHRVEVVRRITDGAGTVLCHVFRNLTLAQEAQMFLDLNAGNQPHLVEKFQARIHAGDPTAVYLGNITTGYGWSIHLGPTKGTLSAVGALERVYAKGQAWTAEEAFEPELAAATLMVITNAWGLENKGVQAVILEGVAALIFENGSLVDLDRLSKKMAGYPGGPHGLHADAQGLAALQKGKVTMAVAQRLTSEYNKGGRLRRPLPEWRRNR